MFRILVFTLILSIIGSIAGEMYIPSMPYIATWFNSSNTQVQYSFTAYIIGSLVPALLFGAIADIYGHRTITLAALGVGLIGTLGCLLAPAIGFFVVCRFVQGFGFSGTNGLGRAILRDYYGGEKFARYSSYLSMAVAFSIDVTPFLGGLLQKHFNWQAIFVFLLLFNIMSLIIAAKFPFKDNPGGNIFSFSQMLIDYKAIVSNKTFMAYNLIASFTYAVFICYIAVAPFLWENKLGLSPDDFGLITLTLSICYVISCYVNSLLIRFGVTRILNWGLMIMLISGVILLIIGMGRLSATQLFVVMAINFIGTGLIYANSSALSLSAINANFASGSAFYNFCAIIIAAICSAIISQFNAQSVIPLSLLIILLSGLALLISHKHNRQSILQV